MKLRLTLRRGILLGAAVAAAAAALYARSVYTENAMPPGSPEVAGRILTESKRCIRCHRIDGSGGRIGPDLSLVALRREPAWIDAYLRDPRAVDPNGRMPRPRLTSEQRAALVAYLDTLDGKGRKPAQPPAP